jgi:hypothetical protein
MARRLLGLAVVSVAALVLAGGAAATLSLTLGSAPSFGVTLDGTDQAPAFSLGMTVGGMNGAFNITASATQFTAGSNLLGFPTVTGMTTGACTGGGCITPVNTIVAYPIGLTGTAQKIYSSLVGKQSAPLTQDMTLAVGGNAFAGSYTSTLTLTIASGP